jgi:hypothetical protein
LETFIHLKDDKTKIVNPFDEKKDLKQEKSKVIRKIKIFSIEE